MAKLEFEGKSYTNPEDIRSVLADLQIPYERWGVRDGPLGDDDEALKAYDAEIKELMTNRAYQTCDIVSLNKDMENLEEICRKFDKEHHHTEDEVRFTISGEGVFEINSSDDSKTAKFTAEAGDLIIVPAQRRHLFYLTDKKNIRCIRLFKTQEGWQAIYEKH